MSEQKAVPEIPEDLQGDYQNMQMRSEQDVIRVRPRVLMEYIERIAALTVERDSAKRELAEIEADAEAERKKYEALREERDSWKSTVESIALMAGMVASETWGVLDILTHVRELREERDALKSRVAEQDEDFEFATEEWAKAKATVERLSAPVSDAEYEMYYGHGGENGRPKLFDALDINLLITGRAHNTPPAKPEAAK